MKNCIRLFLLTIVSAALIGCGQTRQEVYQTSTISALLEGVYDGPVTCRELLSKGDLGLGTFNELDGEMIVLDGVVYKIPTDGKAYVMPSKEKTPFAVVVKFDPESTHNLFSDGKTILEEVLKEAIPASNYPVAIRIDGLFKYVKCRSVPKQRTPYPRLAEVVKHQAVFTHENVRGTIVGFRLPAWAKGVNVPGYHFHFITEDRSQGGHVLTCQPDQIILQVDTVHSLRLDLPQTRSFNKASLEGDKSKELHKVEK